MAHQLCDLHVCGSQPKPHKFRIKFAALQSFFSAVFSSDCTSNIIPPLNLCVYSFLSASPKMLERLSNSLTVENMEEIGKIDDKEGYASGRGYILTTFFQDVVNCCDTTLCWLCFRGAVSGWVGLHLLWRG